MRRLVAFVFVVALIGSLAAGIRGWLAERHARNVFPASQAYMLLSPLRGLVMPVRKSLRRYGVEKGITALELGPGAGYYSIEASRLVGRDGRLICLDLQRDMLTILGKRLADEGCTADLIVGDATHLPLRNGLIDASFLVTVLGEVPEQPAALSELNRVAKAGGRVSFTESYSDPDYVLAENLRQMATAAGLEPESFHRDPIGYTMVFRR